MEQHREVVFERPETLEELPSHYCSGCGHGAAHRLVAQSIDELGLQETTICCVPVGCSAFLPRYLDVDMILGPHGRAPAVATGLKRAQPDKVIFTYQGDGDMAAIGTAEIIHAAARGENITCFLINNAIYGMTGGQMAPTTIMDQVTTTTPEGRIEERAGKPLQFSEIIANIDGAAYVERVSLDNPKNIHLAQKAVTKAFQYQLDGKGFSLVEILSPCPTGWKMNPVDSRAWVVEKMMHVFPLGLFKDRFGG
jgi:2-oxoglutarate ferredoxin oxidoreductase subunit beta